MKFGLHPSFSNDFGTESLNIFADKVIAKL
jgi:hypothetical protein